MNSPAIARIGTTPVTSDFGRKPPMAVRSEPRNLEEIRHRAYELYEASGREDGHDLDDWLRAEEQVTQQKARIIAA
jgi:hypothetical protein